MASKSVRPLPGFRRMSRESSSLTTAGAFRTSQRPAGLIFQDGDGFDWYFWIDKNGVSRIAEASAAEAAGFNWTTGGTPTLLGAAIVEAKLPDNKPPVGPPKLPDNKLPEHPEPKASKKV